MIDRARHEVGGPVVQRDIQNSPINKSFTHSFQHNVTAAAAEAAVRAFETISLWRTRAQTITSCQRLKEKCISKWINKLNVLYMGIGHRA